MQVFGIIIFSLVTLYYMYRNARFVLQGVKLKGKVRGFVLRFQSTKREKIIYNPTKNKAQYELIEFKLNGKKQNRVTSIASTHPIDINTEVEFFYLEDKDFVLINNPLRIMLMPLLGLMFLIPIFFF